ncbi:MAG: N-6 DNA methylase, partial [Candidatus Aminicenantes bacterium]|nr:N-6 DNA methylase [Candidatus Aminicenantes bacterium]
NFEPATPTIEPEYTRDLLKRLYQFLVPKKLRHDLGEYYTPDWIAERILNQVGYDGNPDKRLLDPGCGSGTFLVLAIKKVKQFADSRFLDPRTLVKKIVKNIVGFDLNPLAVIAARTNYLLALGELRRYISPLEIPVYMCDSILTPSDYASLFPQDRRPELNYYPLETSQGVFTVPAEVSSKEEVEHLTSTIEECLRIECSPEQFVRKVQHKIPIHGDLSLQRLEALYQKVLSLQERGENGLWARFIKNAFAPLFVGRFDYVVGNPPWVNWESLSDDYRNATTRLWQKYGLFSLKGWQARMGGGKKDLAMLFTYTSIDNYLKEKGKLGFAITQTLFKTKGAGEGFRRFRLGKKEHIKVIGVDDLVELQPFEGASNWSSIIACQKGYKTKYPVSYYLWKKKKGISVKVDDTLEMVTQKTVRHHLTARPIDRHQSSSPWLTTKPKLDSVLEKVIGRSEYQAREGANTGGANGVYWLRILSSRPDGLLVVENLYDIGRKEVPRIKAAIEPQLVYPLLRGRDVSRWKATPSCFILMVQDPKRRTGYPADWMKEKLPHSYAYLKNFETILRERSAYNKYFDPEKNPFYSMYNIGIHTFASYKLAWRYISNDFISCVVNPITMEYIGQKVAIPDHRLMIIGLNKLQEAHYLCALCNSSISRLIVKSYVVGTQLSTHIVKNINIPKFNADNKIHLRLSDLSHQAHAAAERDDKPLINDIEEEIDYLAASLWGLTGQELREIKAALAELF